VKQDAAPTLTCGNVEPQAGVGAVERRHAGTAWYAEWLDGLRRDGTLTRIVRTGLPFEEVIRVLDALPAADEPIPVFADRVLDDTKALTDGPLRGLVLRAVAAWQQTALPVGGERERALWESVGLVPDDLASQVLVLNPSVTRPSTATGSADAGNGTEPTQVGRIERGVVPGGRQLRDRLPQRGQRQAVERHVVAVRLVRDQFAEEQPARPVRCRVDGSQHLERGSGPEQHTDGYAVGRFQHPCEATANRPDQYVDRAGQRDGLDHGIGETPVGERPVGGDRA
jgi:hypothetical protein